MVDDRTLREKWDDLPDADRRALVLVVVSAILGGIAFGIALTAMMRTVMLL